jgi:L-proline amide hydrolase
MTTPYPVQEGMINFRGYQTWYRIVGAGEEPGRLPLLCLHGGPGVPHDYLESLEAMAATGRRVIFYDQIGCGNSDHVDNPALWTVDLFVEEVGVVRQALGLEHLHILGQSWGGMLTMQYMLTQPQGVASITIASSPSSMALWLAEANRLRNELPPAVQATLREHEAAGTTDSAAYQQAMTVFYDRHVCRVVPNPPYVQRAFDKLNEWPQVYHTMNGPSEFHVIGVIKDWNVTPRLGEIDVPALITTGRHDEATPLIGETVQRGIRGAKWVIFEESAHLAHAEEPARYMAVLADFLARVEMRSHTP